MPDRKKPATWIEALNEHAEWRNPNHARSWLTMVLRKEINPSYEALVELYETLSFMRHETAKVYFDHVPDLDNLNSRLRGWEVQISPNQEARMPRLHLRSTSLDDSTPESDDALIKALEGALLLEFAFWITSNSEKVLRCEGLFRDESKAFEINADERQFREEIPLLKDMLDDGEIQRCRDIFPQKPKGRFCSDACRFSTFQIEKQIKNPEYLAEKQRRYRNKRGDSR